MSAVVLSPAEALELARDLARQLRALKSANARTDEEYMLLARLCHVLGVDASGAQISAAAETTPPAPARGSATALANRKALLLVFESDGARIWAKEELFMRCRHTMTRVQLAAALTALRASDKVVNKGPDRWKLA